MEPDLYTLLLTLHILGAAVWIGASVSLQLLAWRARAAGPAAVAADFEAADWLSPRLFAPASLLTLLAGIGLVVEGGWGLEPFILAGLGLWAVAFVVAVGYYVPEGSRLRALLAERGPADVGFRRRLGRLQVVSRAEDWLLLAMVALMVWKPG